MDVSLLDDEDKKILLNRWNKQREDLLNELSAIDKKIATIQPVAITDNEALTWFKRITIALERNSQPMTSRDILDAFYDLFSDLDKTKDRENMASLSTTLNQHIKRKGDKAIIRKNIEDGKETTFELIK